MSVALLGALPSYRRGFDFVHVRLIVAIILYCACFLFALHAQYNIPSQACKPTKRKPDPKKVRSSSLSDSVILLCGYPVHNLCMRIFCVPINWPVRKDFLKMKEGSGGETSGNALARKKRLGAFDAARNALEKPFGKNESYMQKP